jgi:Undecaprenyl-phosphate glucose phosphotransferase
MDGNEIMSDTSNAFQRRTRSLASIAVHRRHGPVSLPVTVLPFLSAAIDGVLIVLAALLGSLVYHLTAYGHMGDLQRSLGVGLIAAAMFVGSAHAQGHYALARRTEALRGSIRLAATTWLWVFGGVICVIFLTKIGDYFSRGTLILIFVLGLGLLVSWRWLLDRLALRLLLAGTLVGPRIAILADPDREDRESQFRRIERYGYRIARLFFLPREGAEDRVEDALQPLLQHVRQQKIDEILVVADWHRFANNDVARRMLRMVPVPVKFIADAELARLLSFETCTIGAARAVLLKPPSLSLLQRAMKRSFDTLAASLLLLLLVPVFLVVACAIRLESKGPVFFRQWRGGFNGRRFRIFKFRTMHVQEDGKVVQQARRNDPRVTSVGRFLRKTSLDELPQLLNVLLGHMSIVGPRPHALAHDEAYGALISPYPARQNVKPGITGWAQVNGCRGETERLDQMQRRVEMDLDYIRRWSLTFDIGIIVRTMHAVLVPRNAY